MSHPPETTTGSERPDEPDQDGERRERLVTIATVGNEFEANLMVAQLANEGIDAVCFPGGHAALPLSAKRFRIPVQVRDSDEESAREALDAIDDSEIDWETVDVGEREDDLPLHVPGRMPLPAIIAATVVALLLLAGLIGAVILMVS